MAAAVQPKRLRHRWHAPEKGSGPAFALSLLAHTVLFIAIAFAVRWKSEPVGPVSAELWSLPPPTPAVQPPPPPPPPQPVKVEQPPPLQPEPPRKADIVEKKAPPKKEALKKDDAKIAAAKAAKEAAAKEAAAKEAAAKEATAKQAARTEAERKAAQNAALKRLLAQAGPTPAGAVGSGLSNAYEAQIVGCIRPHIVFNVSDAIQPRQYVAEFEVVLLPTGEQAAVPKLLKASGLAAYDQAVERAIRRCDPFPPPKEGTMPRSLRLSFDPVETR